MDTVFAGVWVALGLGMLWFGARLLVSNASRLSAQLRVPPAVVGVTVVALGTSLPELLATTMATFQGNAGIAYGNIVGSNSANILLILGITALVRPQKVAPQLARRETLWLFASAGLLGLFLFTEVVPSGGHSGASFRLSRAEGLVLLFGQLVFVGLALRMSLAERAKAPSQNDHPSRSRGWFATRAAMLIASLALLAVGSNRLVAGAVTLSTAVGVSELVIGLTVVAVGTSTPELATSVMAAWRKEDDIAVSNVTGSNTQNILLCLAVAMVLSPNGIVIENSNAGLDLMVMGLATVALILMMLAVRRIGRFTGAVFLAGMIAYTTWLIVRGTPAA